MVTYLGVQSALKPQVLLIKKTKQNKKSPHLFSHKNKRRVFGYDSKCSRYTTLSEPPWLGAAAGPLPGLQPRDARSGATPARSVGKCSAWTSAQCSDPNKALNAGPCTSAICWKGDSCRSECEPVLQSSSAGSDLSMEQGKEHLHISITVLPPHTGHRVSKQIHNTRTKLYPGSRRNLRNQFHSRPISLPGP